tara:strand:- start:442 stop:663 length:222 start_codon:yes stop_codon:yes gene_type:complete
MKEESIFEAASFLRTKQELLNAIKYPYDGAYTHVTPHKTPIWMRVSVLREMLERELADVNKSLKVLGVSEVSK